MDLEPDVWGLGGGGASWTASLLQFKRTSILLRAFHDAGSYDSGNFLEGH